MTLISTHNRLARLMLSCVLCMLPLCLCLPPGLAHAYDEAQIAKDEAVCAKVDTSGRMSWVLGFVIDARAELAAYDTKLSLLRAMPKPHAYLQAQLNESRGDLLHTARSAFYFTGPMHYPDDPAELLAALSNPELSYFYMEEVETLDQLVEYNVITHLPESPYSTGGYVYSPPTEQPEPGTVVFYSYEIEGEYLTLGPNAREGHMFAVYGRPGIFALRSSEVDDKFLGDPALLEPYRYSNLVFFIGMDPDTVE